nr:Glyoxylate/hydroxypyruvate reductase A [Klebsiella pneumoniae]
MVSAPFRPGAGPPADPNWKLYPQRAAADFHIGIMGLGEIGGYIADQLARLGYRVSGWSRSEKQLAGVTCYRGEEALDHFLGSLDGLINLLPLTAQTRVSSPRRCSAGYPPGRC